MAFMYFLFRLKVRILHRLQHDDGAGLYGIPLLEKPPLLRIDAVRFLHGSIDHRGPLHAERRMRQQEAVLFPVHVVEHEEGVISGIGTGIHDTELSAEVLAVRPPGVLAMEADVRDTDGAVVHLAKRCALMEHRMLLPELNRIAREIVELPIPIDEPPVEPVRRIILTVRIIVSEAGLAELVTRVDQRGALAQHQQQPRVPPHLLPEKLDGLLPGRTLLAAVPAVVLVGTVAVILMILFVMLAIIGEDIHQTHA